MCSRLFKDAEQAVQRDQGVTILVTTHLMDEAEKCDRLAVMHRGAIVAMGTPAELKERIGGDVITLSSKQPQRLAAVLRERLGIEPETIDELVRIERPRAHEFIPQLVEQTSGLIDSVSVGKPTLQDVFIHVTGRQFKDEEI